MNYKLWIAGESKGPCTLEDLRVMWEEGTIDGQTLYAEEGSEQYKPLSGLASILNIAVPESPAPVSSSPPAATAPVPVQNANNSEVKAYRTPLPILAIYAIGGVAFVFGAGLLFSKNIESNNLDRESYFVLICAGIGALFMGYLYDLIAQCLFELKKAYRLQRKD